MPLTPNNREEHWLQGMVDGSTDLTPNNRREHWYKEIIDNGSGGGGGGGGAVSINVTDVPYLAQALQAAVTDAVTKGMTSYANQPIYYNSHATSADIAANMETLSAFLTANEGKAIYLVSSGSYQPINYDPTSHYIGFAMKNGTEQYAYNFAIAIAPARTGSTISGATFTIYGWVTTNIIDGNK